MRKLKLLATERLFKMDAVTGRRGIQAGIRFIVMKGLEWRGFQVVLLISFLIQAVWPQRKIGWYYFCSASCRRPSVRPEGEYL